VTSATPKYKVNSTLGWDWHNLGVAWSAHWLSSMAVSETLPPTALSPFYTGNYWEHDVVASYQASDALAVRLGLINVTNVIPPQVPESAIGTGGGSSAYDNRGRWFYMGATYSFKK
jgi:iron complex outermembrane receptor protein